jgi:uncharacterized OB-fold protein
MASEEELIIYRRSMRIPYRWAAGMTATRFYQEIAQGQKIFGTRCPKCARVLMPARQSCSQCFQETNEWVEVGPTGVVKTFTVAHYQVAAQQFKSPIIYALIQLDGADTAFIHHLRDVDAKDVKTGMRVTAVFAEKASGNILDIEYFKPINQ